MRINNVGDFFGFITGNALIGLAPELSPFIVCMDEFSRMCSCDSIEARNAKLHHCNSFYVAFVSKSNQYKATLLSKTRDGVLSFYVNNQHVVTLKN